MPTPHNKLLFGSVNDAAEANSTGSLVGVVEKEVPEEAYNKGKVPLRKGMMKEVPGVPYDDIDGN